jgi:hypothetical protein
MNTQPLRILIHGDDRFDVACNAFANGLKNEKITITDILHCNGPKLRQCLSDYLIEVQRHFTLEPLPDGVHELVVTHFLKNTAASSDFKKTYIELYSKP